MAIVSNDFILLCNKNKCTESRFDPKYDLLPYGVNVTSDLDYLTAVTVTALQS